MDTNERSSSRGARQDHTFAANSGIHENGIHHLFIKFVIAEEGPSSCDLNYHVNHMEHKLCCGRLKG